ncbi:PAS domain-containing protein [Pseudothauera rhizosphaerae]|nr:PAS domain-containing protein [Pseudothauera rhizosphaerae]
MVAVWVLGVAVLAVYWWSLFDSHARQRGDALEQTRLRAAQTAQALALQVDALVGGVDYIARNLVTAWTLAEPKHFREAVETAAAALPDGALVQVAVADRDGLVVYSNLDDASGTPAMRVSIADREHFRVHAGHRPPALFISSPVRGRVSQIWSVQFSRPIAVNGRFLGVVVVSISPAYLSQSLRDIFPDKHDVALLLREDGSYLARSHDLDAVLGRAVPPGRAFLTNRAQASGSYDIVSPIDGIERGYAWHRTSDYPLLVSLGLDKVLALAPVEALIADSLRRNLVGSVLLVLGAVLVSALILRQLRMARRLAESHGRLELVLSGGGLGAWDWNVATGAVLFDTRWARTLGYRADEFECAIDFSDWAARLHPDDRQATLDMLNAMLRGETQQYDAEYRVRHRDGHWIWIQGRGRVMERGDDGAPLRATGTYFDITARKLVEAERAELRRRLTKLVTQVPGFFYQYLLRPDGTSCFPYASPAISEVYLLTPEEAAESADRVFAILHPDDLGRVSESIRESAERLTTWQCEYRVCFPDGTERWLHGQANPERTEDGGTLWHGYIHDATAAHAAAEALQRSEERLRLTLDAVRDGQWEWDMRSGALHWDARSHEMLGMAPGTFCGRFDAWVERLHPADHARVLAVLQAAIDRQRTVKDYVGAADFRTRTASGEWLWVEGRGRVVDWDGDEPLRMIGTYSDIGQRVADANLRRALLDRSAAAIFVASRARRALYANARARELFGEPGEDMTGFDFRRLHTDQTSFDHLGEHYDTLVRDGEIRCEWPLLDAHGRRRWFDVSGTLLDPEQPNGAVIWMLVDVTERHQAEAALATERLRLTTLLERFPGGVLVEDADGHIVMANDGFCQLFGLRCKPADLTCLGRDDLRRLGGDAGLGWLDGPGSGSKGEQRRTIEVAGAGGRELEVDWVPIVRGRDDLGHVWLVRDITERKRREDRLATLAATDTLTGLPNRRAFMSSLELAVLDPARGGVLLMLDIDHFKRVNDNYGHLVGDRMLQHVAEIVRHELRASDVAGRLGGEEFAVLLPGTTAEDGMLLAERLRAAIAGTPAQADAGELAVSVSIGLCPLGGMPVKDVMMRADEALYAAKGAGRNQVRAWGEQGAGAWGFSRCGSA